MAADVVRRTGFKMAPQFNCDQHACTPDRSHTETVHHHWDPCRQVRSVASLTTCSQTPRVSPAKSVLISSRHFVLSRTAWVRGGDPGACRKGGQYEEGVEKSIEVPAGGPIIG